MGLRAGGGRDRRHVSGRTRAEVAGKVRLLERPRDDGLTSTAGRGPTVGQWLTHWLEHIAARKVRPRTLESYQSTVRLHISPGIGAQPLAKLQPEQVEALYGQMLAGGLSPATLLRAHRVLSRALKVAMQRGKVARNVCTLVDPPAARPTETVGALSAEEARRVLAAAKGERNGARWTVALALGLRQSEALALRWSDVDLERGSLAVQRGGHRVAGHGLVYEEPKSQRSRRTLAVPAQLVDDLRTHRGAQLEERMAAANVWEDHGLMCPAERPPDRQEGPLAGLAGPPGSGGRPHRPTPSRPPHGGHVAPLGRSASPGRHGAARALADAHDDRRLQPRHVGAGP